MTHIEVLKQMIEALNEETSTQQEAIEAGLQAIADLEKQEPVAINSVLQKVMARLADLLDDDKFNEIEGIVKAGGYTHPQPKAELNPDWSLLEATQESLREHMARIKELEAQPKAEQEPVTLPSAATKEANDAIETMLAKYNWPANAQNAGRAGWEAARKYFAEIHPQPKAELNPDWSLLEATQESLREHMARIKELETQLKTEQEPVAWLQIGVGPLHDGDLIARTTKPKEWNSEWWRFEPLYTHPQPKAEQSPLTFKQMDDLIDNCPKYLGRFSTKDPNGQVNYYELIQAVEKAQGIGDKAFRTTPNDA